LRVDVVFESSLAAAISVSTAVVCHGAVLRLLVRMPAVVRSETRSQTFNNAIDMNKSLQRLLVSVVGAQLFGLMALVAAPTAPAAEGPISVDLRSFKF